MVSSLALHLLLCFFFTCSSSGIVDNIQPFRVPIYCKGVLAQEGLTPKSCKLHPFQFNSSIDMSQFRKVGNARAKGKFSNCKVGIQSIQSTFPTQIETVETIEVSDV